MESDAKPRAHKDQTNDNQLGSPPSDRGVPVVTIFRDNAVKDKFFNSFLIKYKRKVNVVDVVYTCNYLRLCWVKKRL